MPKPRRAIAARLARDGVEIGPEDVPLWQGERCDWDLAVSGFYRHIERNQSRDVPAETSEALATASAWQPA